MDELVGGWAYVLIFLLLKRGVRYAFPIGILWGLVRYASRQGVYIWGSNFIMLSCADK